MASKNNDAILLTADFLALRNKLRVEMNEYCDAIATGNITTFEEYKRMCGVIQGLAVAERHLLDLAANIEEQHHHG
jgi:hypothetical protein